ncbi:exodeoxyribonuclease VII large subunit [Clostridium cylindrosporum]|uniref:Exodeoxyribonuclease 7 large subunit n=1 Tax=Clostridium cylindrosporum DSM 605 TaxID=1121307 RepID=A0A0J8G0M6_CLOCY|nr:exodeoxyribonuclease VII large subunit [Clostridium cylindrosporum]KMT21351.1 exodeoxyribonuclease 7 large subunit [Clostridium cylindrosporum DSM 605]
MNNKHFSVYEVNSYIKDIFENDIELIDIYINGEISNFTHHSSGHMYFTLKDDKAKLSCVMFKGDTLLLKFRPQNGQKVLVRGRVSVYERDGKYQVYCKAMQPDGIGSLYIAYEQLKKKLESEGLFDVARKKSLPFFPNRIGVITSPTGAVIRDIINVATNRYKGTDILLYPAKVQGEGAEYTIIEGIEYFNKKSDIDVIIIARGGGSIEELWAFNEESLARAVYSSKIPIVSAIGHETDFTICDFVSDYRASTPSHAAELIVPSFDNLSYKISSIDQRLYALMNIVLTEKSSKVESYKNILEMRSPDRKLKANMQYLDGLYDKILSSFYDKIKVERSNILIKEKDIISLVQKSLMNKKSKYAVLISKLDAMSPINVLKRGYTFTQIGKKVVNSVSNVKLGDIINVNMIDGELNCKVEEIVEGKKWQLEKKRRISKEQ